MRFLADENCDFAVVRALRTAGHDVLVVAEAAPGAEDVVVVDLAVREGRILLTEDCADEFMWHLAQVGRNGLGDRASTCIDPKTQIVKGKTVCLVSCQRSPEPVFLKWKDAEEHPDGDFYVRRGPGTVKLSPASAQEYIRTRFPLPAARNGKPK